MIERRMEVTSFTMCSSGALLGGIERSATIALCVEWNLWFRTTRVPGHHGIMSRSPQKRSGCSKEER